VQNVCFDEVKLEKRFCFSLNKALSMSRRIGSLLSYVFSATACAVFAVAAVASPLDRSLQRQANAILAQYFDPEGPGAVVAVARGDELLLRVGYGLADLDAATVLGPDSVFDLASVSKQFTAAAILLLEADGKLRLNAAIREYLPDFDVAEFGRAITVADLLHHTSGLDDYSGDAFDLGETAFARLTPESHLRWLNNTSALRKPGTRFEYNNSGYALLALLIERLSGQSYREFVQERLFDPVGMASTQVMDLLSKPIAGAVTGYSSADGEATVSATPSQITGDGNIFSNIDDMLAWCSALHRGQPLSHSALERMWTSAKLDSGEAIDEDGEGYGLGWFVDHDTGDVFHSGSWSGTATYIAHQYQSDLFVIVLSNDEDAAVSEIAESLLGLFDQ